MMKPSKNDPFDFELLIRGLGNRIVDMYSHVYEFAYHLTFKKSFKAYAHEFSDSFDNPVDDDFFEQVDDLFVKSMYKTFTTIVDYSRTLGLRHRIDNYKDIKNPKIRYEATRFPCYFLISIRSKSYKRMKLCYERALNDFIKCLYAYASAITVRSNKIPLLFSKQFKLEGNERFRLLNIDDTDVCLLKDLIEDIAQDLSDFQVLNTPKSKLRP